MKNPTEALTSRITELEIINKRSNGLITEYATTTKRLKAQASELINENLVFEGKLEILIEAIGTFCKRCTCRGTPLCRDCSIFPMVSEHNLWGEEVDGA